MYTRYTSRLLCVLIGDDLGDMPKQLLKLLPIDIHLQMIFLRMIGTFLVAISDRQVLAQQVADHVAIARNDLPST